VRDAFDRDFQVNDNTIYDSTQLLRIRHRTRHRIREGQDDDFTVRDLASIAEATQGIATALTLLFGAIGSISLLDGEIIIAFSFLALVGIFFGFTRRENRRYGGFAA
jgi:preprotein translocase subunit SecF